MADVRPVVSERKMSQLREGRRRRRFGRPIIRNAGFASLVPDGFGIDDNDDDDALLPVAFVDEEDEDEEEDEAVEEEELPPPVEAFGDKDAPSLSPLIANTFACAFASFQQISKTVTITTKTITTDLSSQSENQYYNPESLSLLPFFSFFVYLVGFLDDYREENQYENTNK